jgi:acyl-CoA-binding protein
VGASWASPAAGADYQPLTLVAGGSGLRHTADFGAKPLVAQVAEEALVNPALREAVRKQAAEMGGHAAAAAKYYGHQGAMAFQDYIQQGPRGISTLCFVGGVATSALGVMNVCSVFGSVTDPFHYMLNVYMFVFGIVTACIELDPDSVGMLFPPLDRLAEPVTRAQAWLHEECRLLTRLRGRGLFYLYQGTLMVTQCVLCLMFLSGLYNAIMGILCVLMSFGIQPDVEYMAVGLLGPRRGGGELDYENPGQPASARALFTRAETAWKESKEQLPGKTCRELWALHKQASEGDCHVQKPEGVFNGNAKEQWRLWSSLGGMPREEAATLFVERVRRAGVEL